MKYVNINSFSETL